MAVDVPPCRGDADACSMQRAAAHAASHALAAHIADWLAPSYLRCTPSLALAGYLVSVDAYMNLQLANTEEYIDGQFTGLLGEVLIR